jgi:hypothetical protein
MHTQSLKTPYMEKFTRNTYNTQLPYSVLSPFKHLSVIIPISTTKNIQVFPYTKSPRRAPSPPSENNTRNVERVFIWDIPPENLRKTHAVRTIKCKHPFNNIPPYLIMTYRNPPPDHEDPPPDHEDPPPDHEYEICEMERVRNRGIERRFHKIRLDKISYTLSKMGGVKTKVSRRARRKIKTRGTKDYKCAYTGPSSLLVISDKIICHL